MSATRNTPTNHLRQYAGSAIGKSGINARGIAERAAAGGYAMNVRNASTYIGTHRRQQLRRRTSVAAVAIAVVAAVAAGAATVAVVADPQSVIIFECIGGMIELAPSCRAHT